jgi:hypothetical protein
VVLAALVACGSKGDDAQVTTTTTAPSTTTTTAPTTTTAESAARKAATTTTTPKPAATLTSPDEDEPVEIVVQPEHIEPYLLRVGTDWSPVRDDVFGTGPMGLQDAAADDAEDDGQIERSRKLLQDLGFHAGYSRVWERRRAPDDPAGQATHLFAYLYFFGTPQGARAYLDHDAESFEEATDDQAEEVSAGIPGSRAWAGSDEDNQSIAVVLFTVDNFYARVVCTGTHDPTGRCRSWVTEHADQQHKQLR